MHVHVYLTHAHTHISTLERLHMYLMSLGDMYYGGMVAYFDVHPLNVN